MDQSPLSRLPAELRYQIWEYALLSDTEVLVSDTRYKRWRSPALLRCCRELRTEASGLYYTGNTFVFKGCDIGCSLVVSFGRELGCTEHVEIPLASWLLLLDASSRALVRSIHLADFLYQPDRAKMRIEKCKENLESQGLSVHGAALWVTTAPPSGRLP